MAELPDLPESCLACGACCFADGPDYVRVLGDDHARLGERVDEWTVWRGNRCFLRVRDGRCIALSVDERRQEFPCRVYPVRPDTCRRLERGSPECLGELTRKAGRAMALLAHRRDRSAPS